MRRGVENMHSNVVPRHSFGMFNVKYGSRVDRLDEILS